MHRGFCTESAVAAAGHVAEHAVEAEEAAVLMTQLREELRVRVHNLIHRNHRLNVVSHLFAETNLTSEISGIQRRIASSLRN